MIVVADIRTFSIHPVLVGPHALEDATILHSSLVLELICGACSTSSSFLFLFRLCIGAILAIIHLILIELFLLVAYLLM